MGNVWSYMFPSKTNDEYQRIIDALHAQIEQMQENRVPLPVPWRELDDEDFSEAKKDRLLREIMEIQPPSQCQAVNIFVVGLLRSGKSSFVSSLKTVFREGNQISTIAASYGVNYPSTTNKLFEVKLRKFNDGQQLRIFDFRGIAPPSDDNSESAFPGVLIKAINGHIKKGYEFQKQDIQRDSEFYRRNPTVWDKMHCVLFVISSEQVEHGEEYNELRAIQDYLMRNNIPMRLILTKVDKLDLCGSGELSGIFRSRQAQITVNRAKEIFGFHNCQILPIANYVDETSRNVIKDVLILMALDNILQETIEYVSNEMNNDQI